MTDYSLFLMRQLSIGEAGVTAILGYCVVFFGLILLMCVLYCTGSYFSSRDTKKETESAKDAKGVQNNAVPVQTAVKTSEPAPGSAGHVKLYDVPDREAVLIMAIVADKMQKPLNELHFISIREVKDK